MMICESCNRLCAAILLLAVSTGAFKPKVHKRISENACKSIEHKIGTTIYKFQSTKVIEEIKKANADSDSFVRIDGGFWDESVHFDSEMLLLASRRLVALKNQIIQELGKEFPDGGLARELLGEAHHTLQDFYAHSNWAELVNWNLRKGFHEDLGRTSIVADSGDFCPDDPDTLARVNGLTSGYFNFGLHSFRVSIPDNVFSILYDVCFNYPKGKCRHGLDSVCEGINKDAEDKELHLLASAIAQNATIDFTKNLILENDSIKDNVVAVEALMGTQGSLSFVIDDTGSMGDDIDAVVSAVKATISAGNPTEFILVRFGDPDVSPAYRTTNRAEFISAIESIVPSGGGDCAEVAFEGLAVAIRATKRNSDMYVFTDADAKDESTRTYVENLAKEKGIRISTTKTGSCRRRRGLRELAPSGVSPLEAISIATGGNFFQISTVEIADVFKLVAARATRTYNVLYRATGGLLIEEAFSFPVDDQVSTLVITIQSGSAPSVRRPDSTEVLGSDTGVDIASAGQTTIITVEEPEVGEWLVTLVGTGYYSVFVEGETDLELATFNFVELRFGRELAYIPISGNPISGMEQTALASVLGEFTTVSFVIISEDGYTLLDLSAALGPGTDPASPDEFLGTFIVPNEPFGVLVRGKTTGGQSFQRVFAGLFNPQTFSVDLDFYHLLENGRGYLRAGNVNTVQFIVSNPSNRTLNLDLKAVDELSEISQVLPSSLELGPSENGTVKVELIPAACGHGLTGEPLSNRVSLEAGISAELRVNSESVTLFVTCNQPPSCGEQAVKTLWPADNKFTHILVSGEANITDPDGDDLNITILGISQNEPVVVAKKRNSKNSKKKKRRNNQEVDAYGVGTNMASIRAERDETGGGRVYKIDFQASDPSGETCNGLLYVIVPRRKRRPVVIPDTFLYDSTDASKPHIPSHHGLRGH